MSSGSAAASLFAGRMAPLAALAGLMVASVAPLTYRVVVWDRLARQAEVYGGQVGQQLQEAIYRQPHLWRFNAAKVLEATLLHGAQRDIASIDIWDCHGAPVLVSKELGIGTGSTGGPVGVVGVEAFGATAATVSVRIDPASHHLALLLIALVSAPLGLAIGALLYLFPTRIVRRQTERLAKANQKLQAATDALTSINRDLNERIEKAVTEVRQLSARVVQTQEDERRRIARDLHDGLGQAITGLQMELELAQANPSQSQQHLRVAIDTCTETLGELRRVVQEIRPPELDQGNCGTSVIRRQ